MNRFKTIILVGALGVSLPAAVGFTGAANAAEQIKVSDLQLSSPADASVFKTRANVAVRRLCTPDIGRTDLGALSHCRAAVWEEIEDQLTPDQRLALRSSPRALQVAQAR